MITTFATVLLQKCTNSSRVIPFGFLFIFRHCLGKYTRGVDNFLEVGGLSLYGAVGSNLLMVMQAQLDLGDETVNNSRARSARKIFGPS